MYPQGCHSSIPYRIFRDEAGRPLFLSIAPLLGDSVSTPQKITTLPTQESAGIHVLARASYIRLDNELSATAALPAPSTAFSLAERKGFPNSADQTVCRWTASAGSIHSSLLFRLSNHHHLTRSNAGWAELSRIACARAPRFPFLLLRLCLELQRAVCRPRSCSSVPRLYLCANDTTFPSEPDLTTARSTTIRTTGASSTPHPHQLPQRPPVLAPIGAGSQPPRAPSQHIFRSVLPFSFRRSNGRTGGNNGSNSARQQRQQRGHDVDRSEHHTARPGADGADPAQGEPGGAGQGAVPCAREAEVRG